MAASCSYDTSANASPTNKEHLLTDLLDEIQNILEEGLHTYCEEDPLGLKRHDISRSSLGYVRQMLPSFTITLPSGHFSTSIHSLPSSRFG